MATTGFADKGRGVAEAREILLPPLSFPIGMRRATAYIKLLASSLSSLRSPLTRLMWAKSRWSRMRSIM